MTKWPTQPITHTDPFINNYNQKGFELFPQVIPGNPNLRETVGEFIYLYVVKLIGVQKAPAITGMIIDLPHEAIRCYLADFLAL